MRLRNVKNKREIMDSAPNLVSNPKDNLGKWCDVFQNDHPIYVEIGMGKGDFLIAQAKMNPQFNFIGIEKYDSVMARAIEKLEEPLTNLLFIRMDAQEIDEVFFKEVAGIYLNFSDPWPKKRHANRRLTSHNFLDKYAKIFQDDEIIYQKTDNREFFEYSLLTLSNHGYVFTDLSLDLHHSNRENIIMTEYEKKFVEKGNNIYYLVAKK